MWCIRAFYEPLKREEKTSFEMKERSTRGMCMCIYVGFKKSRMTSKEHAKITAFSPHA